MAKIKIPYLKRRGAHFRFEPGRSLRARGIRGETLRDGEGRFLNEQDAIAACRKLYDAAISGTALPAREHPRSVKAMFDALRASPKYRAELTAGPKPPNLKPTGKRLAVATRRNYLWHLARIEEWCGDVAAAALTPEDVQVFYDDQCALRGVSTANAMMRVFRLAYNFAIKKLRWKIENPLPAVELTDTPGRLVLFSRAEIDALVGAADWLAQSHPHMASIGDAIVLAVYTGLRQGDVLSAPPLALVNGAYTFRTHKTGRRCFVPPVAPLAARLEAMAARRAARWHNVTFATEIVDAEGVAWLGARDFRGAFALVRAVASGAVFAIEDGVRALGGQPAKLRNLPFLPQPSLQCKWFSDLRDTAITMLAEAGCTVFEIANITGHSLKSVSEIIDKHYFVRNEEMATTAGAKMDAMLARRST